MAEHDQTPPTPFPGPKPRMTLSDLATTLGWPPPPNGGDIAITGITCRGHEVTEGDLFVVMDEYLRYNIWENGATHVAEALRRGAAALAATEPLPDATVPFLQIHDPRIAFAAAARELYRRPDEALALIGITGTNGKTTTTLLSSHLLRAYYGDTAAAGTLGVFRNGEKIEEGEYTTDLAHVTCRRLRSLADQGVKAVSMEVSSHSLALDRVAGLRFRVGVLTNLTRDHLDFHGTFDAYTESKLRLFTGLGPDGVAVVNGDDPSADRFAEACAGRAVRFTTGSSPADLRATHIVCSASGSRFQLEVDGQSHLIESPLVGRFQVSNILAALGVIHALGLPLEPAVAAITDFLPVPGRMQAHPLPNGATAIIDFAHNPDGLSVLLENCRELCTGRLHVVFGCGGDRDRGKRTIMGEIAASLADICWITSDNPRTEDPQRIIDDILQGARASAALHVEPDRERAIRSAYTGTRPGDLLVIAGKGHEDYQLVGDKKLPFSDTRIVASLA